VISTQSITTGKTTQSSSFTTSGVSATSSSRSQTPPSTATVRLRYETSVPTSSEPVDLAYGSSTLKTNDASNATVLAIVLISSFSAILFLALVFTFLLR
jgi:hypothetical protein